MSDGSTVEEIFVVQCSDKTDASAVKVSMQSLLDSQKQEMERYKPEGGRPSGQRHLRHLRHLRGAVRH